MIIRKLFSSKLKYNKNMLTVTAVMIKNGFGLNCKVGYY